MIEVIQLMEKLSEDFTLMKEYIMSVKQTKPTSLNDTWMDGQEVMLLLKISKRTLQSMRDNGTLPFSRINGKFYYKAEDIQLMLESNYSSSKKIDHGNDE
jgi:hypothetical protein